MLGLDTLPHSRRSGRPSFADIRDRAVDLPIEHYRPEMFDPWLMARLDERWPGFTEASWRGKLAGYAGSNDYLFITNGQAMLLMECRAHAMTMKPVVMEVFAWARDAQKDKKDGVNWVLPQKSEGERHLHALYRRAKQWMLDKRGVRMIVGTCSDMAPGTLKMLLDGDYIVDVLA